MGKIYIIIGKSSTGKDTIYQRLLDEMADDLKNVVMYTTRPIRDREQEGREYFFVNEEKYQSLKAEGKVIEERAYHTVYGIWRYFTVNDGKLHPDKENYIMTGTLEAYLKLKEYFGEQYIEPIYIEVETGERLTRALAREKKQNEPKYVELCRRFIADEEDFSEENIECAGIVRRYENVDLDECVAKVKSDIRLSVKNS